MNLTKAKLLSGPGQFESLNIPFCDMLVPAGKPNGGFDEPPELKQLAELLVRNPDHTFSFKAIGSSMTGSGINDGDILIVDRTIVPKFDSIVLFLIDDEFTVKRFERMASCLYLVPTNPAFERIKVKNFQRFRAWGVIIWVIQKKF